MVGGPAIPVLILCLAVCWAGSSAGRSRDTDSLEQIPDRASLPDLNITDSRVRFLSLQEVYSRLPQAGTDDEPVQNLSRKRLRIDETSLLTNLPCSYNHDLSDINDYNSLCKFLIKESNDEELHFLSSKSDDDAGQCSTINHQLVINVKGHDLDVSEIKQIRHAQSTVQKLILIANLYRKLIWASRKYEWAWRKAYGIIWYWMYQVCRPVLRCVMQCCEKDLRRFQTIWGNPLSQWKLFEECSGDNCRLKLLTADPTLNQVRDSSFISIDRPGQILDPNPSVKRVKFCSPPKDLLLPVFFLSEILKMFDFGVEHITDYTTLCAFLKKQPDDDGYEFLTDTNMMIPSKARNQVARDPIIIKVLDDQLILTETSEISSSKTTLEKLILVASLCLRTVRASTSAETMFFD